MSRHLEPSAQPGVVSGAAAVTALAARDALSNIAGPLTLVAGFVFAGARPVEGARQALVAAHPSDPGGIAADGLAEALLSALSPSALSSATVAVVQDIASLLPSDHARRLAGAGARSIGTAPVEVAGAEAGVLLLVSAKEVSTRDPEGLSEALVGVAAAQVGIATKSALEVAGLRAELANANKRFDSAKARSGRRTRAARELVQRNRELLALNDIAHALNQAVGLDAVLRRAVDSVVEVTGADAALVRLVEGPDLVLAAHRGFSRSFVEQTKKLSIDSSASGLAIRLGQPQVIPDCAEDTRIYRPTATREGMVSAALLPMIVNGKAVGILNAFSRRRREFGDDDVRLLSTLAAEIGVAVENARMYEGERTRLVALEELDRLKTDFVATISHELRTPMAIVKASLDALLRGWDSLDEDRRRSYVSVGRQGASRLQRLLEDLLLVSRIETRGFSADVEAVDVGALAREVADEARAERPTRPVEVSVPTDLPLALADRAALAEVLSNLLDNAAKYSPEGTRIVLSASVVRGEVQLSVTDQGIGIAPEDMPRLFRRFERIDPSVRSQTGTGLGLYICRQLAESMGGRIWAESEVQKGSSFHVALRIAADSGAASPLYEDVPVESALVESLSADPTGTDHRRAIVAVPTIAGRDLPHDQKPHD